MKDLLSLGFVDMVCIIAAEPLMVILFVVKEDTSIGLLRFNTTCVVAVLTFVPASAGVELTISKSLISMSSRSSA